MHSWVDGQPAETVPLKDRGLAYGDGVFETISVKAGIPVLIDRHFQRLAEGCRRLVLDADQPLIRSEVLEYADLLGNGVLKLILTRGDSERGYWTNQGSPVRRILQGGPLAIYPQNYRTEGIRLFPCVTRLAEQPLLAGLKHLNRIEQVIARAEWQDSEHAEGLMLDSYGRVIEGVFSNLFLARRGLLLTADLGRCGVAGVMRAEILSQAQSLGIPLAVIDISLEQLQQADEVFMCNSVYGIWPVLGCSIMRWSVGPLTRRLQRVILKLLDI